MLSPESMLTSETISSLLTSLANMQRLCLQALENAQVKSGKRVLIHGGSGGVGSVAVQIAKAWGAHVTSTCSTKNVQLVKVTPVPATTNTRYKKPGCKSFDLET